MKKKIKYKYKLTSLAILGLTLLWVNYYHISYSTQKYIFNNPVMHLYHHAYKLPKEKRYGVNFGISLSVWDYLFGTSYVPEDSGTIEIGFKGDEKVPISFWKQLFYGFKRK